MKNKIILFIGLIICVMSVFVLLNPSNANTSIINISEKVNSIYETNILLKNDSLKSNVYYPIPTDIDYISFRNVCNFFNVNTNFSQTGNYFKFENPEATAYYYFKNGQFQYKNLNKETKHTPLTQSQLLYASKIFFEESLLPINYSKSQIIKENDNYRIKFINTLDGIDNYSFNNNILMDKYGNTLELNYYFIEFKKMDSKKTLSMHQCYNNLPIDLTEATPININNIELVYVLEDSLVQTAYKFDSKDTNDNFYEIYIKNTIYLEKTISLKF